MQMGCTVPENFGIAPDAVFGTVPLLIKNNKISMTFGKLLVIMHLQLKTSRGNT